MTLFNMTQLRAGLRRGERLIGLDPGARRIGVALSDAELRLATPYATWPHGKLAAAAAAVTRLAREEQAGGLVIGYALEADGRAGRAAQAARDWAHALSRETGLPAALWDERYTTVEAAERLADAGIHGERRSAVIDRTAAAVLLQSALDGSSSGKRLPTPQPPDGRERQHRCRQE